MDTCPICSSELTKHVPMPNGQDAEFFNCTLCGKFILSGTLVACISTNLDGDPEAISKVSHAIRRMQSTGRDVQLHTGVLGEILKQTLPKPKEQANLFILWLSDTISGPGMTTRVRPETHRSIIGAKSKEGFAFVLDHLISDGLIVANHREQSGSIGKTDVTLSFKGWEIMDELKKGKKSSGRAFMAMQYGDDLLEEILETIFKPSALDAGFRLEKLDDVPMAGLIDDRLRVEIQLCDFVIADLTHDNRGAYWEAGYAEGLGKPVIYTCEQEKFNKEKTHFDTNHHLTIPWSREDPRRAGERLKATIRATLPHLAKQDD